MQDENCVDVLPQIYDGAIDELITGNDFTLLVALAAKWNWMFQIDARINYSVYRRWYMIIYIQAWKMQSIGQLTTERTHCPGTHQVVQLKKN